MPRLFVAIDLPVSVKQQLSSLSTRIDGVRWTETTNLHLTLRFIGDVPQHTVSAIQAALLSVQSPPFSLQVSGVGTFPGNPRKPPRIIWAGLSSQPPALTSLYETIEANIRVLGLPPDDKPYTPHITLARVKSSDNHTATAIHQFIERNAGFHSEAFIPSEFHLMESQLAPSGPKYVSLARYPLNVE
jgi:RNA 2',3'-cyclic 3'-phosphodiesterase